MNRAGCSVRECQDTAHQAVIYRQTDRDGYSLIDGQIQRGPDCCRGDGISIASRSEQERSNARCAALTDLELGAGHHTRLTVDVEPTIERPQPCWDLHRRRGVENRNVVVNRDAIAVRAAGRYRLVLEATGGRYTRPPLVVYDEDCTGGGLVRERYTRAKGDGAHCHRADLNNLGD